MSTRGAFGDVTGPQIRAGAREDEQRVADATEGEKRTVRRWWLRHQEVPEDEVIDLVEMLGLVEPGTFPKSAEGRTGAD